MTFSPILELADDAHDELHHIVRDSLRDFNRTVLFPQQPNGRDLAIGLRDPASRVFVGGLLGRTSGSWLAIELLFVPESLRGMGLATKLIAMAEDEARRRGCHSAWIDTLNDRARVLYERLGYAVFGELEDYPVGSSRFFLRKKL